MNKLDKKIQIRKESKSRMATLTFGDKVTNICAGEGNQMRHCFFVEYIKKSTTNKYGITNTEHLARCTDGKAMFWNIDIEVIYPGWLDAEKCKELHEPVWQAEFGS